jgi:hypothetical protein
MKQSKRIRSIRRVMGLATSLVLAVMGTSTVQAYRTYSGGTSGSCIDCHQDFLGSHSEKGTVFPSNQNHEMHRATTSMATGCNLCHTGTSSTRKPVYIGSSNGTNSTAGFGCSGCHVGAGLRAHHAANNVTVCADCHPPETPDPEDVTPPYYTGMWANYTKVRNPGNTVMASNTNENWSIGDYIGLDNDGNNLYDLADYKIGPPDRILGLTWVGNDARITWQTVGGRTNDVQAAGEVSGTYSGVSPLITSTNVGLVTTNYLLVGGATNAMRFFRLHSVVLQP